MKLPLFFLSDSYKQFHWPMYPPNLIGLYNNFIPRKSRIPGINQIVVFGIQYLLKEYFITQMEEQFFNKNWSDLEARYKRFHKYFSGVPDMDARNWHKLHELGYLPLEIQALAEGTLCPIQVPFLTCENTHEDFAWLTNYVETIISNVIWDPITVATIAHHYRKLFDRWALETSDSIDFVQWQGHDFSMRGRTSIETSMISQMGHLLSFTGTDTVPAVLALEEYYNANMEKELIGASVPATEHSVMMVKGKAGEFEVFSRLLDTFPNGIISIVSDTYNFWLVLNEFLPKLKDKIMSRNGKVVIRPDSGDPADIICGTGSNVDLIHTQEFKTITTHPEYFGAIEILAELFETTVNSKGYKELNPHIGLIYGDAITPTVAEDINQRLANKGFASTNWVAGIGSYTYNYNTRDTFGMAIKATAATLEDEKGWSHEVITYKDPITSSGEKKSLKGRIYVSLNDKHQLEATDGFNLKTFPQEGHQLRTVFCNGKLIVDDSLSNIRKRLKDDSKNY